MELKFSDRTVVILDNFSKINTGMLFRTGKELRTCAPGVVGYYAVARIAEEIPREFGIFNLSMFIQVATQFKDSVIHFTDSNRVLHIKDLKNRKFEYVLAPSHLIQTIKPGPIPFPDANIIGKFELPMDELKSLRKTLNIGNFTHFGIQGDGQKIRLLGYEKENPSSNRYSIEVGECDREFSAAFVIQKIEILLGAVEKYEVSIAKTDKGFYITRWHSEDVDYFIASEAE